MVPQTILMVLNHNFESGTMLAQYVSQRKKQEIRAVCILHHLSTNCTTHLRIYGVVISNTAVIPQVSFHIDRKDDNKFYV